MGQMNIGKTLHVEANKEIETQPNDIDLLLEVDELVKNGLKTKDACKQVATKYKVSKNDLYNNFLITGK